MSLKLVAGLGNPGAEYERTPHNVGFRVVNRVAELASASWRDEPKFKGSVARIRFQGAEALLLKPLTYMNLSGEAVGKLAHYFGVKPADFVVVSDDADLPVGRLRIRPGGGSGGHRGLQSVIDVCGTNAFARVRVGIGRSAFGGSLADFVLGRPAPEDEEVLRRAESAAAEAVMCVLTRGTAAAMNRFNGESATAAETPKQEERG